MRSFVSLEAQIKSYGTSVEVVNYFKCLGDPTPSRLLQSTAEDGQVLVNFTLTLRSGFDASQLKKAGGKGIVLKNISQDKILSFGVAKLQIGSAVDGSPAPSGEMVALCSRKDEVSVLFQSKTTGTGI